MKYRNKETVVDCLYRDIEAELQVLEDPKDVINTPLLIRLIQAYRDFVKSYYKNFQVICAITSLNMLLEHYGVKL